MTDLVLRRAPQWVPAEWLEGEACFRLLLEQVLFESSPPDGSAHGMPEAAVSDAVGVSERTVSGEKAEGLCVAGICLGPAASVLCNRRADRATGQADEAAYANSPPIGTNDLTGIRGT